MLLDLDGTILVANPAALRVAGRPLAGTSLYGDDRRWRATLGVVDRTGTAVDHLDLATPSGPLPLHIAFAAGDDPDVLRAFAIGDPAGAVPRMADDQAAANQRLESLGLVAGGIAHDFNNLLVGVLAEASAAREQRDLSEGTRDALRRIEAAARRMAQLTR